MSIQSEINRISGNVSDSLDAVAEKGVTVPQGANSDDLAGLIAIIPGLPSGGTTGQVLKKNSNTDYDVVWGTDANSVTGVKGNSESSYRTGNVNITAANVGAVATSGNETIAGNKIFSGTTTLSAGSTYPAAQNAIIEPNPAAIIQSPIPKYLWHDVLAFCRATTPTYYTTTDGTNWTQATLEKRLFGHMNAWGNQQIINSTISGGRWVWHGGAFGYSSIAWIVLGITYNANIAAFDMLLETTSDSTADSPEWTTLCEITNKKFNQKPVWIKTSGPSSTNDLRLTIKRTSGTDNTTVLPLCSIQFLTSRWGDQGKGEEFEHPYTWDNTYSLTLLSGASLYPYSNNAVNIGSSSKKWANIYATTFNGALSGNATTATNAPTQASINSAGLITYKNSSGTSLFTLQLPIYDGSVT